MINCTHNATACSNNWFLWKIVLSAVCTDWLQAITSSPPLCDAGRSLRVFLCQTKNIIRPNASSLVHYGPTRKKGERMCTYSLCKIAIVLACRLRRCRKSEVTNICRCVYAPELELMIVCTSVHVATTCPFPHVARAPNVLWLISFVACTLGTVIVNCCTCDSHYAVHNAAPFLRCCWNSMENIADNFIVFMMDLFLFCLFGIGFAIEIYNLRERECVPHSFHILSK